MKNQQNQSTTENTRSNETRRPEVKSGGLKVKLSQRAQQPRPELPCMSVVW